MCARWLVCRTRTGKYNAGYLCHAFDKNKRKAQENVGKGDWIMRKIKLTRANKIILLKALGRFTIIGREP